MDARVTEFGSTKDEFMVPRSIQTKARSSSTRSSNPVWKSSQQITRIKPYRAPNQANQAAETKSTRSTRMVSFLSLMICILTDIIMSVHQEHLCSDYVVSIPNAPEPQFGDATNSTIEVSFRRTALRIPKNYTPFTVSFEDQKSTPPVPANLWLFYVIVLPAVWLDHVHRML